MNKKHCDNCDSTDDVRDTLSQNVAVEKPDRPSIIARFGLVVRFNNGEKYGDDQQNQELCASCRRAAIGRLLCIIGGQPEDVR